MSYCRMGDDSDVYAFPNVNGNYECCACILASDQYGQTFTTAEDLRSHLHEHLDAFHRVPTYALERLREEIEA